MQRQAVPLVRSEAPYIGTGIETDCATDAGDIVLAQDDGTVIELDAEHMVIDYKNRGRTNIALKRFERSNQDSCISQKPRVAAGDRVTAGQLLADGPLHRQRGAGARQEPARGLHALGGLQLRGRHHPL